MKTFLYKIYLYNIISHFFKSQNIRIKNILKYFEKYLDIY